MSEKIEISRELLARTYWELDAGTPSIATLAELQAILAAPVVERQEPVALVLNGRREPTPENPYLTDADHEWNACLDKVKELNQ
jgi:hypothetical protein